MCLKKSLVAFLLFGSSLLFAQVNAVVSILPQKTFLEKLGGEHVDVALMVLPGSSPHNYEPKPSQMRDVAKANLYFSIGIEFEEVWLSKFGSQNPKMKIVDSTDGIERMEIEKHSHKESKEDHHHKHAHHNHDHHEHDHGTHDPHVWVSPANVKIIAKNMAKALIEEDSKNRAYYEKNLDSFLKEIEALDKRLKEMLEPLKESKFMVFHPSWGYFARDYGLIQLAIEADGKEPKPKELANLIKEAKSEGVKAVFTAPEFSDKAAKTIAKEVGVPVVALSPLNPKWAQNLLELATNIAK